MYRVVWPFSASPGWAGGINYYCNLAKAVQSLPARGIEIMLPDNNASTLPHPLNSFPILNLPHLRRFSTHWWISKLTAKLSESGGTLATALAEHGVDLWSHGNPLGRSSPVPSLCWIPDFQEVRLPEFFTAKERKKRAQSNARIAAVAQGVVLSSRDAYADFCRLFPQETHKAHVLHFVADVPSAATLPSAETVLREYDIAEPYLYVPNQLWAHKNHEVILNALALLKKTGISPLVISTGLLSDYRNPGFPQKLLDNVQIRGFAERFRFLGLVPFTHVAILMRHCIALINPSRFEGWSTTVEEAKSLGKRVLLSDLPVHREQAPFQGLFFEPDNAEALAEHIRTVFRDNDQDYERIAMEKAALLLPERMAVYGKAYETIAQTIITSKNVSAGKTQ